MTPIVWVHRDCLDPRGPALAAYSDAPAIWVWDEVVIDGYGLTLKRIAFIYECLLDLPVTIRRGDVAEEVLRFAHEHGATTIATTTSASPRFAAIRATLAKEMDIEALEPASLLAREESFDLRRFARYWREAERLAFRGNNKGPEAQSPPERLSLPGMNT